VTETIVSGWRRSFSPNAVGPSYKIPMLQVSDMVYVPRTSGSIKDDVLVLVGTTNGEGPEFGGNGMPTPPLTEYGFVTKLTPKNGEIDNVSGSTASIRIGVDKKDTSIRGVCFQKGIVDVDHIYVVGFTRGLLEKSSMRENQLSSPTSTTHSSKHAFVAKLKLLTLEIVWSRQIGSQDGEDILGHGCDVTQDGSTVYLAGTVKDGGSIKYIDDADAEFKPISAGGDDLFVASYTAKGNTNFIRQFGTTEDDTFAKGRGIVCDEKGNAILLGNTRGSMMRLRETHNDTFSNTKPNDIFVLSIGKKEGRVRSIAERSPEKYTSSSITQSSSNKQPDTEGLFTVEIVAIVTSCIIFLLAIIYALCSMRNIASDGKKWDSNDKVMDYLDEFNDNDIELHVRHSATGGVHGIYDFEVKTVKAAGKPQLPSEVSVGSADGKSRRPPSRLSKTDSLRAIEDALSIVDSNKARMNTESRGSDGTFTSSETVQASNMREDEYQITSEIDDFSLPVVNESEEEEYGDREII